MSALHVHERGPGTGASRLKSIRASACKEVAAVLFPDWHQTQAHFPLPGCAGSFDLGRVDDLVLHGLEAFSCQALAKLMSFIFWASSFSVLAACGGRNRGRLGAATASTTKKLSDLIVSKHTAGR